MRSNGSSSAGSSDLLNNFSARREMRDNRRLIWFAGAGCSRLLRFACHRLRNRGRPRKWRFENFAQVRKITPTASVERSSARFPDRDYDDQKCTSWTRFGRELAVDLPMSADLDARLPYLWPRL